MKWLITVSSSLNIASLGAILSRYGGKLSASAAPVPMGREEYVVEAEGPPDLPSRIRQEPGIAGVYPNSELTLF